MEQDGDGSSFRDLVRERRADLNVLDHRQQFPKDKDANLLPRTRAKSTGQMYQTVSAIFEIAELIDSKLIEIVRGVYGIKCNGLN